MSKTIAISDRRIDNIKACEKVDSKLLSNESLLLGTKYANYAFIGPVEATKIFRREYTSLYQEYYGRFFDYKTAKKKLGVKRADLFENDSATINSLWKARQQADDLGMPYDLYVRYAFEILHRRGWKKLPRPNQLYEESLKKAIEIEWSNRIKERHLRFPLTDDPRFLNSNYRMEPAQQNYRKLLIKRGKSYPEDVRKSPLAYICFTAKQLEPKVISEVFELDVNDVRSVWDNNERPYRDDIDDEDFRRPCYGMPHVKKVHECRACPLKVECKEERVAVEKVLLSRHESIDLSGEKRKAQQRERKRRQRQREREKLNIAVV